MSEQLELLDARQRLQWIARHPATGLPIREDVTCGECAHHVVRHMANRYHKCELHRLGLSASSASDIRVRWPGCSAWKASP